MVHKYYQCTSQMRCSVTIIIFTKFWVCGGKGLGYRDIYRQLSVLKSSKPELTVRFALIKNKKMQANAKVVDSV